MTMPQNVPCAKSISKPTVISRDLALIVTSSEARSLVFKSGISHPPKNVGGFEMTHGPAGLGMTLLLFLFWAAPAYVAEPIILSPTPEQAREGDTTKEGDALKIPDYILGKVRQEDLSCRGE